MIPATAEPGAPAALVTADAPVLLVGAGPVGSEDLRMGLRVCAALVAADGGAAAVLGAQAVPDAVIGDMDSIAPALRARIPPERLFAIDDQDSTDFEKCLTRITAPVVLAMGFSGGRMDHLLAVLNAMVRHPARRCVLIGPEDAGVLLPPALALPLPVGAAVSLFPLAPATVGATGLHWPVDGLAFRPDGQIGTSNRAIGPVSLRTAAPGLVLFVARAQLGLLLAGLEDAPGW